MAKRVRLDEDEGGLYFTSDNKNIEFITSGCCLLDCILGGGYPLGRMTNVIGDKSTAKTGLATEAVINFLLHNEKDKGAVRYCEAESAFDFGYAEAMGMPLDLVDFGDEENPVLTVEDLYRDLNEFLDNRIKNKKAGLYVIDSLDGLADEASLKLDISDGSYSMTKQKQLGKLFSHMNRKMEKSKVNLFIVSQVRDNIGVSFGEKHRRSGGKAMDFYASQFLWLHHIGYIHKEIKKVKRPIGIKIKAKVKKNKVGLPFRECEFDFVFGYGIEDIKASVKWLNEVNRLKDVDLTKDNLKKYISDLDKMDADEYAEEQKEISEITKSIWREIETSFLPTRTKYGN